MSLLKPKIWRACAGATLQFPTLNSTVYYFPQGHMDQQPPPPPPPPPQTRNLSPLQLSRPYILCTISDVQFLADPNTDEVFAKLILHPIIDFTTVTTLPRIPVVNDGDTITSFTKILTPSDVNSCGGFSVPRHCAQSIFPLLDLEAENHRPTQTLVVTDVHGKTWEFRHSYRGTPKRHLLTTGWRTFINSKSLIAGDSVVFMKNSSEKMFIGIRGTNRFGGVRKWTDEEEKQAELAVQNLPFEVVYYPKTGWSDFVVKAEVVDYAMSVVWSRGMKVKMAVETDNLSRMTRFHYGTVSSRFVPDNGPWRGSPWRMLQITWDDPILLQNFKWVSPWQVELVSTIPSLHAPYPPPTKKFRAVDGYGIFPAAAGTQASHDPFSSSSFSNFLGGNSSVNNTLPRLKTLSTELSVGNYSQSDDLQSDSQSSLSSFGTELRRNHGCNSTKPRSVSFQLFGAIIQLEQTLQIGSHDITGCVGGDSSKGCNETEGDDGSVSYLKLLDRLDDQCQRGSTEETRYS